MNLNRFLNRILIAVLFLGTLNQTLLAQISEPMNEPTLYLSLGTTRVASTDYRLTNFMNPAALSFIHGRYFNYLPTFFVSTDRATIEWFGFMKNEGIYLKKYFLNKQSLPDYISKKAQKFDQKWNGLNLSMNLLEYQRHAFNLILWTFYHQGYQITQNNPEINMRSNVFYQVGINMGVSRALVESNQATLSWGVAEDLFMNGASQRKNIENIKDYKDYFYSPNLLKMLDVDNKTVIYSTKAGVMLNIHHWGVTLAGLMDHFASNNGSHPIIPNTSIGFSWRPAVVLPYYLARKLSLYFDLTNINKRREYGAPKVKFGFCYQFHFFEIAGGYDGTYFSGGMGIQTKHFGFTFGHFHSSQLNNFDEDNSNQYQLQIKIGKLQ